MDNFEKHIRDHASQFNERRADKDKMWAKISEELHQEKSKVIPLWKRPLFRMAASVLLLLGLVSTKDKHKGKGLHHEAKNLQKSINYKMCKESFLKKSSCMQPFNF